MRKAFDKILVAAKFLLLPGVILRAFNQHVLCRVLMIPVTDKSYLHPDGRMGMISHEPIKSAGKSFIFCWLHRTLADLIAFPMIFLGAIELFYLDVSFNDAYTGTKNFMFFVYVFILWAGLSVWSSRYPCVEDADGMWKHLYDEKGMNVFMRILLFVPALRIRLMSRAEKYGINILFALALIIVLTVL